ncbi:hypothetical protein [Duganella sp. LjRoot269]|uniref:hypothetical protein n=1 Tax=Duganella sp. LjRoot269 TaxID=3342305 RepID=UPI003ED13BD6
MNGFSFKNIAEDCELMLEIKISKEEIIFKSLVYSDFKNISIAANKFQQDFNDHFSQKNAAPQILIGPEMENSPHFFAEFRMNEMGKVRIKIDLYSIYSDVISTEMDFASIHLIADVSQIDQFSQGLIDLAEGKTDQVVLQAL